MNAVTIDSNEAEPTTSLGDLLKKARIKQDISLADIADDTKISLKTLEFMEDGNYEALPADAFTRGFYTLYAKTLGLDPTEIINLYNAESGNYPQSNRNPSIPPSKRAHKVGDFAARPNSFNMSSVGLLVFLLLIFGAFLCWYFSWNPATFLSQKLRSFQDNPPQVQQSDQLQGGLSSTPSNYELAGINQRLFFTEEELDLFAKKRKNQFPK